MKKFANSVRYQFASQMTLAACDKGWKYPVTTRLAGWQQKKPKDERTLCT
jgi:hypothetical protein